MNVKCIRFKILIYLLTGIISFNTVICSSYINIPESPKKVEASIQPSAGIPTWLWPAIKELLKFLGLYLGEKALDGLWQNIKDGWSDFISGDGSDLVVPEVFPIEDDPEPNLIVYKTKNEENPTKYDTHFSPQFVNYVINQAKEVEKEYGYFYTYSFEQPYLPSDFTTKEAYDFYIRLLNNYPFLLCSGNTEMFVPSFTINSNLVVYRGTFSENNDVITTVRPYNPDTWTAYYSEPITLYNIGYVDGREYRFNFRNSQYPPSIKLKNDSEFYISKPEFNATQFFIISKNSVQFITFKTENDFKNYTGGILPFYEGQNWNNYVNGNVDEILTVNGNENYLQYGDIVDYVTTNNIDNHQDIYNYINNYGSSGGGGSGDSGGGSGGGINLDFLGALGKLIASIINGIGNMINELLTGIIDTVTKIVDNLSKLLSGVANIIPESFTALINAVFSWLPEELRVLIVSSVTLMILVGIIKLIRGS